MKLIIEEIKNGFTVKVESSADDKNRNMMEGMGILWNDMMNYFKDKGDYLDDPELWKAQHEGQEGPEPINMGAIMGALMEDTNSGTFHFATFKEIVSFLQKYDIPEVVKPPSVGMDFPEESINDNFIKGRK